MRLPDNIVCSNPETSDVADHPLRNLACELDRRILRRPDSGNHQVGDHQYHNGRDLETPKADMTSFRLSIESTSLSKVLGEDPACFHYLGSSHVLANAANSSHTIFGIFSIE